MDPWSYTQTVENFFYLSCRVKSGNVGIFLGADNDVYVRPFNAQDIGDMYDGAVGFVDGHKADAPPRVGTKAQAIVGTNQFVLQIDYQSWLLLVRDLKLSRPALPHRRTGECEAAAAPCGGYSHYTDGDVGHGTSDTKLAAAQHRSPSRARAAGGTEASPPPSASRSTLAGSKRPR